MALIPGTLPSDTCYGTPQDLLELFAQYLDVPAFALNSKVVFGTSSAGLTADVIWFDTGSGAPASATNPILKITVSGGFVDYVNNYLVNLATKTAATGDFVLVQDISDSNKSKKVTAQTIANLAPTQTPANGSITAPKLSGAQTGSAPIYAPRAWILYDGVVAGGSILASGNISTHSDDGVGLFTVNFATSMPAVTYTVMGTATRYTFISACIVFAYQPAASKLVGSCKLGVDNVANAKEDAPYVSVSFLI